MLMHNGMLADPLYEFTKATKKLSGKRNKTEADHEELARLEFLGGLYMGQNGQGLTPVIPAQNIRKMLILAARKSRDGKLAESGVYISDEAILEYDGPRNPDELWANKEFVDRRLVVVNRARIARTRPIFKEWEANVTVDYDTDVVTEAQLDLWFEVAGKIIGLGDNRPQNGKFTIIS
jgi:hypothetical protein